MTAIHVRYKSDDGYHCEVTALLSSLSVSRTTCRDGTVEHSLMVHGIDVGTLTREESERVTNALMDEMLSKLDIRKSQFDVPIASNLPADKSTLFEDGNSGTFWVLVKEEFRAYEILLDGTKGLSRLFRKGDKLFNVHVVSEVSSALMARFATDEMGKVREYQTMFRVPSPHPYFFPVYVCHYVSEVVTWPTYVVTSPHGIELRRTPVDIHSMEYGRVDTLPLGSVLYVRPYPAGTLSKNVGLDSALGFGCVVAESGRESELYFMEDRHVNHIKLCEV